MSAVELACVFIRAAGDRLVAAERLVLAFPRLFGSALLELDLAYRMGSRFLVADLRFSPGAEPASLHARLAFWAARAGGRATALDAMPARDLAAFRASFDACELKVKGILPGNLFDASGRLFTDAGAPAARHRSIADPPVLAMDVGGQGWEGIRYEPDDHALFVPAPLAPPLADELPVSFRVPGRDRPLDATAIVADVRTPAESEPGQPAGYTLVLESPHPELHEALARHAPLDREVFRVAPRYVVKAPVKVVPLAGPGVAASTPDDAAAAASGAPAPDGAAAAEPGEASPRALIAYATEQELADDYVENLSQGGAFVRTPHPFPVGTTLGLDLRLPNGAELRTQAQVVFAREGGMGVKFALGPEEDEVLAAAIAHISARPRRALVVDDDALVREMLADALHERGFEVITARDGATGLQTLSEEVLALDLLVTDVRMPGLDGEAFVRTIRQAGGEADLAIVAVTGRMDDGLEPRLESAGADAVLDKALGAELIAQAADAVLERKRLVAGRDD